MVKLNIGSGPDSPQLEGFTAIDRAQGREAFPLPYADGSVDEIYASHVLEHFGLAEVQLVLNEWARVLKPGGRMRVGVPDFRWCAQQYLSGQSEAPIMNVVMGGQTDANDFHRALFDEPGLRWQLEKAGLVGIQKWASQIEDCASLPCSLNLEGYKPVDTRDLSERCIMVATMPRLNWTYNRDLATLACFKLNIPYINTSGAYFDQSMERALENGLDREYIITMDYDTIFTTDDVKRLVVLMDAHPEAGAIAAMQAKRGPDALALISRDTDKPVTIEEAWQEIFPVKSAHFGLTIIRSSVLKAMPKPWLHHSPAPDGSWGEGRVDADVSFWHKLNTVSQTYVSPRVNVGHLQVMVSWVDGAYNVMNQHLDEYQKSGKPKTVRG